MKKKSSHLELPKQSSKKKWKEICDLCQLSKEDVHGYYSDDKTYVVCPECAKKLINKSIIKRDWKGRLYGENNINNNGREEERKEEGIKSEGDKNSSNIKDEHKNSRQLLHSGVSGREKSTEHNITRGVGLSKKALI